MSAELPDISVIIPHFNQPEHLANCLRSLTGKAFDLDRVEFIVVDNGSKVLPIEICARFSHVQLVEEKVPGPGPARNTGIGISTAPLLAFIDADCIAGDGWLAAVKSAFADRSTEIIGGDVRIGLANPPAMTPLEAYESAYAYRQKQYIERQGFSGTGNLAMRREVYEQVGPFAGIGVAEDREWGRRATRSGHRIRYVPEMIVYHPARKTLSELYVKWDRHLAHDYADIVTGWVGRLRWSAKALALAASPVWEFVRILRSDRIAAPAARASAFGVLIHVRLHRARIMFRLLLGRPDVADSVWSRRTG